MINRYYYLFQAQKMISLLGLIAIALFTCSLALPSIDLVIACVLAGIVLCYVGSLNSIMNACASIFYLMLILLWIVCWMNTIQTSFDKILLGLFAGYAIPICVHRVFDNPYMIKAWSRKHPIEDRHEEKQLLKELSKKTQIIIDDIFVFSLNTKELYAPNVFVVGGIFMRNAICIDINLLDSGLTKEERKAIYAHELGHIKYFDSLLSIVTTVLSYMACILAFISVHPLIFMGTLFASIAAKYSVRQSCVLLADLHSALHTAPEDLISILYKLEKKCTAIADKKLMDTWRLVRLVKFVRWKYNTLSYPKMSTRLKYLRCYCDLRKKQTPLMQNFR